MYSSSHPCLTVARVKLQNRRCGEITYLCKGFCPNIESYKFHRQVSLQTYTWSLEARTIQTLEAAPRLSGHNSALVCAAKIVLSTPSEIRSRLSLYFMYRTICNFNVIWDPYEEKDESSEYVPPRVKTQSVWNRATHSSIFQRHCVTFKKTLIIK